MKRFFHKLFKSQNKKILLGVLAMASTGLGGMAYFEAKILTHKNTISVSENGAQSSAINLNNSGTINTLVFESSNVPNDKQKKMTTGEAEKNRGEVNAAIAIADPVKNELDRRRVISMSVEVPAQSEQCRSNKLTVVCEFTYFEPGDDIPRMDSDSFSPTARNPIARIYNKTARMNCLQWELNELPEVPTALMRPKSMNVIYPAEMSETNALKELERSLDESNPDLEKMLAANPSANRQLAYTH